MRTKNFFLMAMVASVLFTFSVPAYALTITAGNSININVLASDEFDSFSLNWGLNDWDMSGDIAYDVYSPTGELYFHHDMDILGSDDDSVDVLDPSDFPDGLDVTSDFDPTWNVDDVSQFFGNYVTFVFTVSKGWYDFKDNLWVDNDNDGEVDEDEVTDGMFSTDFELLKILVNAEGETEITKTTETVTQTERVMKKIEAVVSAEGELKEYTTSAESHQAKDMTVTVTPEPATLFLLGSGILGLFAGRKYRKKR
jgi:hypothetical protein